GTKTCAGYPSSFDHEFIDAQTFADFGIDFLKYDFCYKPAYVNGPLLYHRMGMALKATGREILFSACNWGSDEVGKWIRSTGAHMYRSTGDINDSFNSFKDIAKSQLPLLGYSAPGCYNDIDMLIVGMGGKGNVAFGGCTDEEYFMHFALWCMMASPLMIGCDIRNMSEATVKTLTNKNLIALNQDEEARPCFPVSGNMGDSLTLFRHLSNNEYCLGVFNFTDGDASQNVEFYDIGLSA
ncbi:MAG: glycoside hydrolase family 27 protein, partial [Oscillospiraceae bacterium]